MPPSSHKADHHGLDVAPLTNAPSGQRVHGGGARPPVTVPRELYMIGNAHLDPVWLWPWQEGYQEARATFASALDRMDEYPDFVFTSDQVVLLDWVKEAAPELFERIRQRVAEGRWVNTGGWWVEPDCNMPGGESFVRQGLYGQNFLQREFGQRAITGMNVDPFGHNAALPQILKGQGMGTYTFLRPGPHEATLPPLFWWQGPDGSRVLASRILSQYQSREADVSGPAARAIAQDGQPEGAIMVFYGVGNHGGGPTKANIESIGRYDRMATFGRMRMASPDEFFADLHQRMAPEELASLPVVEGDLQHHAPGCYSSQSMIKYEQRRAQHVVLAAERWAAVAARVDSMPYPLDDLETAWKQVLFNQFHDVLPGSAIESAYVDARDQLGEAISIAKRVLTRAQNRLARHVDIALEDDTYPMLVFNPHPWEVTAPVEMEYVGDLRGAHVVDGAGDTVAYQAVRSRAATDVRGGSAVVFEAQVPSVGYALYRIRPGERPSPLRDRSAVKVDELSLENEHLRVELDPSTGWLKNLVDKASGADPVVGATGPHTVVSQDPTDTWGHHVVSYSGPGVSMHLDGIEVDERGPLRGSIVVTRSWGRSSLTQHLSLVAGERSLRVAVTLDWREKSHLLKMRFPVSVDQPRATFEIPFAHLERPVDGAEQPGQSWMDLSGDRGGTLVGLSVLNDAKHGYDASPSGWPSPESSPSLGITAVRSPVYSWHDPLVLGDLQHYVHQDQGVQKFAIRMVPHSADWSPATLARLADEMGQRQRAMMEGSHAGGLDRRRSFVECDDPGVLVSALKLAEDGTGDTLVRAVERDGADHRQVVIRLLDVKVTAPFGPFQIRTFRIDALGTVHETNLLEDLPEATTAEPTGGRAEQL